MCLYFYFIYNKKELYIKGCPFLYWVTCQQCSQNECQLDYAVLNSKILLPASCYGVWAVSLR